MRVAAEILTTVRERATYSVFGHALSRLLSKLLPFIIFIIVIHFSLNNLHYVPTAAGDHVGVLRDQLRNNEFLDLLIVFAHKFPKLLVLYFFITIRFRARCYLRTILELIRSCLIDAFPVQKMKATCRTKVYLKLLIQVCQFLFTEHAFSLLLGLISRLRD
jgi:hypothetical protein